MASNITFLTLATSAWGAENSLLDIAAGLSRTDSCSLLAFEGELQKRWDTRGLGPTISLGPPPNSRVRRMASAARHVARLKRTIIVVFDIDALPVLWLLRAAIKQTNVVVLDLHDVLVGTRGRRRLDRFARCSDHVVCVSNFAAKQLGNSRPVTVIDRPVANVPTLPRRDAGLELTVGVIGRVSKQKMVLEAIEAVAGARIPLRLVVRGAAEATEGEYLRSVQRLGAVRLGCRFALEGPVEQERAMEGIDILLLMNIAEPSGRVVAEAQLAGIPAVCPREGGAAEFVQHGVSGALLKSGTFGAPSTALDEIAGSDLVSLRRSTKEYASERYNYAHSVARYLSALRSAANRVGKPDILAQVKEDR